MNSLKIKIQSLVAKADQSLTKKLTTSQFTYQQIFRMLIPLIIDQFFIGFISMITASLISTSGEASMTAVALVNPITMMAMFLFAAVSSGGTVIVAQYKGKGDSHLMKKSAAQVILTTFLVATTVSVILIIFARPILTTIYPKTEAEVLDKAVRYLIGFCFSIPTFSIFNGVFNVLRGVGDTKVCLRLTVVINIIHLIASYVFINMMKLDIMGTALAFNIARFIGCAIALYIILSPKGSLTLKFKDFLQFDLILLRAIVKMGVPFAVEHIFFNAGLMIAQIYIAPLGESTVAANAIAASVSNLIYSAGFGVATLAITVVGQCMGAGEIETAKLYGKRFLRMGTIVMIAAIAIIYPLSPLILKLFNPKPTTLPLINMAILIGVIPIPFFWSSSNVLPSVLRAAGDVNYSTVVSLITMWTFRIGLGYLLAIPFGLGLNGIWIGVGVEWAARTVAFKLRFKGTKWLEKKVV